MPYSIPKLSLGRIPGANVPGFDQYLPTRKLDWNIGIFCVKLPLDFSACSNNH